MLLYSARLPIGVSINGIDTRWRGAMQTRALALAVSCFDRTKKRTTPERSPIEDMKMAYGKLLVFHQALNPRGWLGRTIGRYPEKQYNGWWRQVTAKNQVSVVQIECNQPAIFTPGPSQNVDIGCPWHSRRHAHRIPSHLSQHCRGRFGEVFIKEEPRRHTLALSTAI